jgi:hypothetical protein
MLERVRCPLDRGDCDGDARNGCETDLTDIHHCGRCDADCARPNMDSMCVGDRCRHRCSEGYCDAPARRSGRLPADRQDRHQPPGVDHFLGAAVDHFFGVEPTGTGCATAGASGRSPRG